MTLVQAVSLPDREITLKVRVARPVLVPARTLRWPVGGHQPARLESFRLAGDRYVIGKSPAASLVYAVDLADWLAEAGTTLKAVTSRVRGVTLEGSFMEGTCVAATVSGFAKLDGAPNCCTFDFECKNGQQSSVTIYFEKA